MITNSDISLSKESYINKDFGSIYPSELDLAKQLTNKWDPSISNESDPGVVLLKEAAFIADHLNYNSDKNILERFLPTAKQESSVRNLVETNGYSPKYYLSATGDISITFNPASSGIIANAPVKRFTLAISSEDSLVTYTQASDFSISSVDVPVKVKFIQGSLVSFKVNGSNIINIENIDSYNRLYFSNSYVAQNGVYVRNIVSVNSDGSYNYSDYWSAENYLTTQPRGSLAYKIDYDSYKRLPYIEFPSDISEIIGAGLEIKYISTSGINGNVSKGALTKLSIINSDIAPQWLLDSLDSESNYIIGKNERSIINGKDPETIDEMYNNFKKVVGTFDTLVTCKDYENAIYNFIDNNENYIVSNALVTDIRTDYNKAINIITFDKYGTYLENASLCEGRETRKFILPDSSEDPEVGDYTFDDNAFKIYTSENNWVEATNISFSDFVDAAKTMTPFDITLYALKMFSIDEYDASNKGLALSNSFKFASNNAMSKIKSSVLSETKALNHTYNDITNKDVYAIRNHIPLDITVIPELKITKEVRDDIINNILIAISINFNSREIEFGEELNYDKVKEVILKADPRISDIRLGDFINNTPKAAFVSGNNEIVEEDLYTGLTKDGTACNLLVDMVAKNVLSGRLALLDFDNRFKYRYGQIDAKIYNNVSKITPDNKITLSPESGSASITETIDKSIVTKRTFKILKPSEYTGIRIEARLGSIDSEFLQSELLLNSLGITFSGNDDEELRDTFKIIGYKSVESSEESSEEVKEEVICNYSNLTKGYKLQVYGIRPSDGIPLVRYDELDNLYVYEASWNGQSDSDESDIEISYNLITDYESVIIGQSSKYEHTINQDNEFITIAYPNCYSTVTYPEYCSYRYEYAGGDVSDNLEDYTIYRDTDTEIPDGCTLFMSYTSNSEEKIDRYDSGTIVRIKGFDLTFTEGSDDFPESKKAVEKQVGGKTYNILSSGQQIAIRKSLLTVLESPNTPCYWIRNNANNTLFPGDTEGSDRKDSIILRSGEYFIFANSTKDVISVLGAGTRITRKPEDMTNYTVNKIDIESINSRGADALSSYWVPCNFSENHLELQEMNMITLSNGDKIRLFNLEGSISESPIILNSDWQELNCDIEYTIDGESPVILRKRNSSSNPGYLINSRLDVNSGDEGQELISLGAVEESITIEYYDKDTIKSEKITKEIVQSSIENLNFVGDDSLDTSALNLDIMTFKKSENIINKFINMSDYDKDTIDDLNLGWVREGDYSEDANSDFKLFYKVVSSGTVEFKRIEDLEEESSREISLDDFVNRSSWGERYGENSPVKNVKGYLREKLESSSLPDLYFKSTNIYLPKEEDSSSTKQFIYEVYNSCIKEPVDNVFNTYIDNNVRGLLLPFSYVHNNFSINYTNDRGYIIPIYVEGADIEPLTVKARVIPKEEQSEKDYDITMMLRLFGSGDTASETIIIEHPGMYLVELVPEVELISSSTSDVIDINENIGLTFTTPDTHNEGASETISVYNPTIYEGTNKNFESEDGTYSIDKSEVIDRIKYLVSKSTKPDTSVYYINVPDNSTAIQDCSIYSQDFLYDKNNVANKLVISEIDIDDKNFKIDIYKSMRDYK